jgi:hypothetical protein
VVLDRLAGDRAAVDQAVPEQLAGAQAEADQLGVDQVEATAPAGAMATAGAMVEVTAIDRLFPNGATSALPHYWSHRLPRVLV